ncbi:hypothetical protein [Streptomyces sp. NPDC050428]|uniref:hypothetical protein n=1 Tax=Streptomyces sp. NPDC050428 TaxID=3155757 RepID=UPI0034328732
MAEIHKITNLDEVWQPGDVVLDAAGNLRIRSAHPRWVWDYPNEGSARLIPEGGLDDSDVPRPLTLLVRHGQAVGGRIVE